MTDTASGMQRRLAEAFLRTHPDAAARAVEKLATPDIVRLCTDGTPSTLGPVLARMNQAQAATALATLEPDRAAQMLETMDRSSAVLLLRRLLPATAQEILSRMPVRAAASVRATLRLRAGSAAALCDPDVLTVADDCTAGDAINAVERAGRAHYYVFIVDRGQRLLGVVNLRDLIAASRTARLTSFARTDIVKLQGNVSVSAVLEHPAWQNLHALPVVDADGRFLGLIRHETVRKLEAERTRTTGGESAVSLAVEFGELVWAGAGVLMHELGTALSSEPGTTTRDT